MKDVFAIHKTQNRSSQFLERHRNSSVDADQDAGSLYTGMFLFCQQVRPEFVFVFEQMVEVFLLEYSAQPVTPFCWQEQRYLEIDHVWLAILAKEDIAAFIHVHITNMSLVDRFQKNLKLVKEIVRHIRFFIQTAALNIMIDQSITPVRLNDARKLINVLELL